MNWQNQQFGLFIPYGLQTKHFDCQDSGIEGLLCLKKKVHHFKNCWHKEVL